MYVTEYQCRDGPPVRLYFVIAGYLLMGKAKVTVNQGTGVIGRGNTFIPSLEHCRLLVTPSSSILLPRREKEVSLIPGEAIPLPGGERLGEGGLRYGWWVGGYSLILNCCARRNNLVSPANPPYEGLTGRFAVRRPA